MSTPITLTLLLGHLRIPRRWKNGGEMLSLEQIKRQYKFNQLLLFKAYSVKKNRTQIACHIILIAFKHIV